MSKRCPNGSRKNRKTGKCVRKTGTVLGQQSPSPVKKIKRCPNGTRKNRKTGKCVETRKRVSAKRVSVKNTSVKSASVATADFQTPKSSLNSFHTPPEPKLRMNVNRAT